MAGCAVRGLSRSTLGRASAMPLKMPGKLTACGLRCVVGRATQKIKKMAKSRDEIEISLKAWALGQI